ncbi:hypothetical protein H6G27_24000 [Nostoc linckia FACHB-104]|nr:hypothetical protein [Nostoc linckia FACHB-104]
MSSTDVTSATPTPRPKKRLPPLEELEQRCPPHEQHNRHPQEHSLLQFKAIGVVTGDVRFSDERNTITVGGHDYTLLFIKKKLKAFESLKRHVETSGQARQRVVVYPKVTHFPKKDEPHIIAFQVVGFDVGHEENAVSGELEDLEFKVSGFWQFIPVCPTPCITVLRNFTRERLEFMKHAEPGQNVWFMKASHIPVLWKDAPVKPYRFNPKAEKEEQGHPPFVAIKAKFLPQRNVFACVELIVEPQEKSPKFLKVSKTDKTIVQEAKKQQRKVEDFI